MMDAHQCLVKEQWRLDKTSKRNLWKVKRDNKTIWKSQNNKIKCKKCQTASRNKKEVRTNNKCLMKCNRLMM